MFPARDPRLHEKPRQVCGWASCAFSHADVSTLVSFQSQNQPADTVKVKSELMGLP